MGDSLQFRCILFNNGYNNEQNNTGSARKQSLNVDRGPVGLMAPQRTRETALKLTNRRVPTADA